MICNGATKSVVDPIKITARVNNTGNTDLSITAIMTIHRPNGTLHTTAKWGTPIFIGAGGFQDLFVDLKANWFLGETAGNWDVRMGIIDSPSLKLLDTQVCFGILTLTDVFRCSIHWLESIVGGSTRVKVCQNSGTSPYTVEIWDNVQGLRLRASGRLDGCENFDINLSSGSHQLQGLIIDSAGKETSCFSQVFPVP